VKATTLRAYAELVRLPNLPTAAADVLAGFLFAGGQLGEFVQWIPLVVSSVLLYAGGVALNDVCDAPQDAASRPNRPLPSGRIARSTAFRLALLLFLAGLAIPAVVSWSSVWTALVLLAAILLYDAVLKLTPFAPLVMGCCRALNLALGMLATDTPLGGDQLAAMLLLAAYIACITVFARREESAGGPWRLRLSSLVASAAVLAVMSLIPTGLPTQTLLIGAAVSLSLFICFLGQWAAFHPVPERKQLAMKFFLSAIIALDAMIAWTGSDMRAAAAVSCLILPTLLLSRAFRMT